MIGAVDKSAHSPPGQKEIELMAYRVTKDDLEQAATVANNMLEHVGHPERLYVQSAYGQPRVHWTDGRDASPRGTKAEVYMWLNAFIAGLAAAGEAARQ